MAHATGRNPHRIALSVRAMNVTDLHELDGKVVLVTSAADHENPPTGMRGTIHVAGDAGQGRPAVQVDLDFPQMFTTRAHHRRVTLTDGELDQLLASGHYGAYSVTLHDRLDPQAPQGSE